jgi:hypothetical protein
MRTTMRALLRGLVLTVLCYSGTAVDVATQAPPSISRTTGLLRVPPNARLDRVTPAPQRDEPSKRGVGRAILGGAAGAVGGFFAGGYTGALIEGDRCSCDDPGLKGAVIGAPIGAVAGAVLGAKYLF